MYLLTFVMYLSNNSSENVTIYCFIYMYSKYFFSKSLCAFTLIYLTLNFQFCSLNSLDLQFSLTYASPNLKTF